MARATLNQNNFCSIARCKRPLEYIRCFARAHEKQWMGRLRGGQACDCMHACTWRIEWQKLARWSAGRGNCTRSILYGLQSNLVLFLANSAGSFCGHFSFKGLHADANALLIPIFTHYKCWCSTTSKIACV